jgi:hypothetical protein
MMYAMTMRDFRCTWALVAPVSIAAALVACGPGSAGHVDTGPLETSGDGDGDPTTGDGDPTTGDGDPTTGDGDPTTGDGDPPGCASALDILLVVDNSGSMATAQRRLATGINGLVTPLDAAKVDWRLGITTTDNGNPWCPAAVTTPEHGHLVLSSCKTRLDDFLFGANVDVRDEACNDICEHSTLEVLPTSVDVDPNPKPRPWIEKIGGITNIGGGVSVEQALACVVPQGVNGCGFEQPLEASYLALVRAQTASEPSYGFLRAEASLLVVVISDEVDCSHSPDWSSIFMTDGNKAFWSDPTANFPTSAVCWNAGVACEGDPSHYTSCVAQDYDVTGAPTNDPSAAVLRPLSRYAGLLAGLEIEKKQLDSGTAVQFAVIGGVDLDGSITYADSSDPGFQNDFGIGPTCGSETGTFGLPLVRMRELAEATGGRLGSICEPSYSNVLSQMVVPFVASCG